MKTSEEQESEAVWAALRGSRTAPEPGTVEDPRLGVTNDECPEAAGEDDLEAGDREELEGDGDDDD